MVQEPPVGLPPLERRRQLDIVLAVAQISLLAQALGGIPAGRGGPQMGLSEGSHRQEQQTAQQEEGDGQASRQVGSERSAPQEEPGQHSDAQYYRPLSFAQVQSKGEEERELGELPFTREQMRQAGTMLQARVAQEQCQQAAAPARGYVAITTKLSSER